MADEEIDDPFTVQYSIVPVQRYEIQRTTTNDEASVIEGVAILSDINDARRMVRAITEYERRNPQDRGCVVLKYDDVELH